MKRFQQIAVTLAALSLMGTAAHADVKKGQKLYQKKLQKVCGMNGGAFAAKHTQEEWEEAKEEGTLAEVMTEACPGGKAVFQSDKFESSYKEHIYDFVYEYASDSGNVPSC